MELLLHTEGWFDAAHHLNNYDGPCKFFHGHTYKLEVWIKGDSSQRDSTGILFDFSNIKKLTSIFDHNGDMTDKMGCNSTAENQCIMFYNELKNMAPHLFFKIRIYEQVQPKESWCQCGDFE